MEEITTSTLTQKKTEELPKKHEKIITEDVKRVKSGKKKKFLSALFSIDDVVDIKDYLVYDCLVPAFKNTISDMIENSVSMVLFGDTRASRRRSSGTMVSRTSYADYYNNGRRDAPSRARARDIVEATDIDDIIFPTKGSAMDALDTLLDDADRYGKVRIADFYDICGLSTEPSDSRYGWTRDILGSVKIQETRGGYVIRFPRPIVI